MVALRVMKSRFALLIGGTNLSYEEYLEAYWLDWVFYPPLYEAGNSTARTKLLLYLHSFFRPQDLGWKFFTCCRTGWLENDSGIHQQTCKCERNFIWKHAYCSKMLVTQKRKKGRRGSKGRLGSWGRVITVSGFCCSRSAASAHCHTLSLNMVVEIACGVNHAWCGWDQNHHRALWSEEGRFRYYLRPPSIASFENNPSNRFVGL